MLQEQETLKEEMDAWVKSLRQELQLTGSQLDDAIDELQKHKEELQFNYDNISMLQGRIDGIELTLERLVSLVEGITAKKTVHMAPLKAMKPIGQSS